MIEVWKPIPEWLGYYEASDRGNIRAVRYDNHGVLIWSRLCNPSIRRNGYLGVGLSKECKVKSRLVHRLVASAFLPNPDNIPEVNHIDGNKQNNSVENLVWCTTSENLFHAYAIGLKHKYGKRVRCIETGVIYDKIKDAGNYHIAEVCNGKHKTANGYHWEWVE